MNKEEVIEGIYYLVADCGVLLKSKFSWQNNYEPCSYYIFYSPLTGKVLAVEETSFSKNVFKITKLWKLLYDQVQPEENK